MRLITGTYNWSFICKFTFTKSQNILNHTFLFIIQLGTLGAGNHYAEIQVVDEIYHEFNARKMGIEYKGQVGISLCIWYLIQVDFTLKLIPLENYFM